MKRHLIALLAGSALGAILGWFTPEIQGLSAIPDELRRVLALKNALILGSTADLVSMYLTMRKRALARWTRRD
jgi:hypothetical protein